MKYQYILFDLDGTLTDSAEDITNGQITLPKTNPSCWIICYWKVK